MDGNPLPNRQVKIAGDDAVLDKAHFAGDAAAVTIALQICARTVAGDGGVVQGDGTACGQPAAIIPGHIAAEGAIEQHQRGRPAVAGHADAAAVSGAAVVGDGTPLDEGIDIPRAGAQFNAAARIGRCIAQHFTLEESEGAA